MQASALAIMEGHGTDNPDPFINVLQVETVIEHDGAVQIPQDLVTVALKDGQFASKKLTFCVY